MTPLRILIFWLLLAAPAPAWDCPSCIRQQQACIRACAPRPNGERPTAGWRCQLACQWQAECEEACAKRAATPALHRKRHTHGACPAGARCPATN